MGADGSAGREVIVDAVDHRVACVCISSEDHERLLMELSCCAVEQPQVVGERRFQSRVSLYDVQRVAGVANVEELCHAWLRRAAAIGQAELGLVVGTIAIVYGRSDVEHISDRIGMNAEIVLSELRALWLEHHSRVQLVLVAYAAEHEVELLYVVLIL